jgi:hypothetical protein
MPVVSIAFEIYTNGKNFFQDMVFALTIPA